MIYEFECPKGHVTEASVPMGTTEWPCEACKALYRIAVSRAFKKNGNVYSPAYPKFAKRILSPTRTTFVFADTHRR